MSTTTHPTTNENLAAKLPAETHRSWLRDMLLIREFEVRCMQAYQNRKIGGFLHVYIGQEACAVGCVAAMKPEDPLITAYRDHGHGLARGMDPRHAMAEMYGKITGCAKGKGGSMHVFDKRNNMFGGHGIVGAQCPLGVGLAFATKYEDEVINGDRSQRVTLCFLGDGALNQGAFHEAMNLAGLFDLPIIFVCENNGYSMGTSITRGTTMGHDITVKAKAYGMDSATIDGMDVFNVYNGMRPLVDQCRESSRPVFVDLQTYRYKGHSMSDPRKYRTKDEEKQYEENDCIDRLANWMMEEDRLNEDDYDAMVKEARGEVRDAMKWADESPEPPLEELYTDVYVGKWGPYLGTSPPLMLQDGEEENENDD